MKIRCGKCGHIGEAEEIVPYARYKCKFCEVTNEVVNVSLQEWLGYDFNAYLSNIERFIKGDKYQQLLALNDLEREAGKLSQGEIDKLKNILIMGFNEGLSIREIRDKMVKEINIRDLREIKDGQVTDRVLAYGDRRPIMIARTEATRAAAQGSLLNYRDNDIEYVRYIAGARTGVDDRTCDECDSLNGSVMTLQEAEGMLPIHPYCRCLWIAIPDKK